MHTNYISVRADAGEHVDDLLREASVLALKENVIVKAEHNEEVYIINPLSLLSAASTTIVTEK